MALSKEGKIVWADINDLSALSDVRSGDKFIVQTSNGTKLLDFSALLIPLSNVTFKSEFEDMLNSYSSNSELINKIGGSEISVDNLSAENQNLSDAVNQLNINIGSIIATINAYGTTMNKIIKLLNDNASILTDNNNVLPLSNVPVINQES